jgi:hypothetical protein
MYYLRSRPKADAIQFTVDQIALAESRTTSAVMTGTFAKGAAPTAASTESAPGGTPGHKLFAPVPFPNDIMSAASSPLDTADSSRVSSPTPIGFTTPPSKRPVVVVSAAAGGTPGDAAAAEPVAKETHEEMIARVSKEAAETRRKIREEFESYQADGEICLSCGS